MGPETKTAPGCGGRVGGVLGHGRGVDDWRDWRRLFLAAGAGHEAQREGRAAPRYHEKRTPRKTKAPALWAPRLSLIQAAARGSLILVAVHVALEGALDADTNVAGLVLGKGRQLHAEFVEVELGHLLVEVLRQDGDGLAVLVGVVEELDLRDGLVRERRAQRTRCPGVAGNATTVPTIDGACCSLPSPHERHVDIACALGL